MIFKFFQNDWFCQFWVYRVKPESEPEPDLSGNVFSGPELGSNF
jgi:hypothetical protein